MALVFVSASLKFIVRFDGWQSFYCTRRSSPVVVVVSWLLIIQITFNC